MLDLQAQSSFKHIGSIVAFSVTVVLSESKAFAFDPTAIASGLGGVMDGADQAISVGFALTDLLGELGVAPESEEEVKKAVGDLQKLNSRIGDLNSGRKEISELLQTDLSKAKSLQEKLRSIKTMITASKRIAEIMGLRPKAGAAAAQIQQMKINSMMLDELQAIRRQMFLTSLEERKDKARRSVLLDEIQNQERKRRDGSVMRSDVL